MTQPRGGFDWSSPELSGKRIVKRMPISGPGILHECSRCGRVFRRKYVRYMVGHGWICSRCDRRYKGPL